VISLVDKTVGFKCIVDWGDHSVSYFLLPLPDSLELVLEPDPELELSPSLELSELLLSLSRDT